MKRHKREARGYKLGKAYYKITDIDRAEHLERKVRGYKSEDTQEGKAESYREVAKAWLVAKKPRRAINSYKTAVKYWQAAADNNQEIYFRKHKLPGDMKKVDKYLLNKEKDEKNINRLKKVLKGDWHGLEGKFIVAITGIIAGLFFLSPNITGNAIANLTNQTSNIIGGSLFVIGIIGSYFWIKKR